MCQVVMHAVRKVKEGTAVERGRKEGGTVGGFSEELTGHALDGKRDQTPQKGSEVATAGNVQRAARQL